MNNTQSMNRAGLFFLRRALRMGVCLVLAMLFAVEIRAADQSQRGVTQDKAVARSSSLKDSGRSVPARGDRAAAISNLAVSPARTVTFTEEREAAATIFVRKHLPELEPILNQLKLSKPAEYQQVMCDLFRTSELFAAMRQEDAGRYELALKSWQVESRTELLAAELVAHPEQRDRLVAELQSNATQLVDLEIEQAAYEIRRLKARLQRAEGQRQQMEKRRQELIDRRLESMMKAIDRLEDGSDKPGQAEQ